MKFLGYTISQHPPIERGFPKGTLSPVYVMINLETGEPGELVAVIDEKLLIHSYLHAMWYILDIKTGVGRVVKTNWWLYALIIVYVVIKLIWK